MSAGAILPGITPNWRFALGSAVVGHAALAGVLMTQRTQEIVRMPDPVMVVELPAGAAPSPAAVEQASQQQPMPQVLPDMVPPRIEVPRTDAPLPPDPVTVPAPRPVPRIAQATPMTARPLSIPRAASRTAQAAAPATGAAESNEGPATDPETEREQADWYSLVSAHLERNKRYPREARRDGLQGTPTVRFTVNRRGRVSDVSIRDSSGHPSLDEATISLLKRVSPLPAMPRSMRRDSVTITLPIEYSLSRK